MWNIYSEAGVYYVDNVDGDWKQYAIMSEEKGWSCEVLDTYVQWC